VKATGPGITAEIVPRGPFSLRAAAGFGFGPNQGRPDPFDGNLRLAFCADGGGHAGVALRQDGDAGVLQVLMHGTADPTRLLAQTARILSLDHDGQEFLAVGERDPVIGRLQREHPGQRPVLFSSPYEAAAWSIISARRPAAQGARVRAALAEQLGKEFVLAGRTLAAFPEPQRLLAVEPMPGLPPEKVARLHGVAEAALDGRLDPGRLQELGPERATEEVRSLRGIGPFYAGLIVLRASGFADAMLSAPEPKVMAHVARLYGLPAPRACSSLRDWPSPGVPFARGRPCWCAWRATVPGRRAIPPVTFYRPFRT